MIYRLNVASEGFHSAPSGLHLEGEKVAIGACMQEGAFGISVALDAASDKHIVRITYEQDSTD